jgi:hypothetical protein
MGEKTISTAWQRAEELKHSRLSQSQLTASQENTATAASVKQVDDALRDDNSSGIFHFKLWSLIWHDVSGHALIKVSHSWRQWMQPLIKATHLACIESMRTKSNVSGFMPQK